MIKEVIVTVWQTSDGKQFPSPQEAQQYEDYCRRHDRLDKLRDVLLDAESPGGPFKHYSCAFSNEGWKNGEGERRAFMTNIAKLVYESWDWLKPVMEPEA